MLKALLMLAVGQRTDGADQRFERITSRPATSAIDVDGRLDEPAWTSSVSIPLPYEIRPRENAEARVRTDCQGHVHAAGPHILRQTELRVAPVVARHAPRQGQNPRE